LSIELHCSSCGKLIRAPREAAGRRSRCPACGNSLYIPTPEDEIQELPLAPEDEVERRQEEELLAERRRLDRILLRETSLPGEPPARSGDAAGRSGGGAARESVPREPVSSGAESIESVVLAWLRAMRQSDLSRADQHLHTLLRQRAEAVALLDRLAADQMPPPAMADVPPAVYHGFLRNLRTQLQT
jgi:hypothetical protein